MLEIFHVELQLYNYTILCAVSFAKVYSFTLGEQMGRSIILWFFLGKLVINLLGTVQTLKFLNEQPAMVKGKKKKKDAGDMSEPKVHTADSAHIDNSELFPAEDGDVSGFFAGEIYRTILSWRKRFISNAAEDAKVERFLLVLVVMKRVMVLQYLCNLQNWWATGLYWSRNSELVRGLVDYGPGPW